MVTFEKQSEDVKENRHEKVLEKLVADSGKSA